MKLSFNVDSLNQEVLQKEMAEEAHRIYNSPKARGNRTAKQVFDAVRKGHPAELFLREKFKFYNDPDTWHDLISHLGLSIEVKTWHADWIPANLVELANKRMSYLRSDWVFIFTCNRDCTEYELYGVYKWQPQIEQYVPSKFDWAKEYAAYEDLELDRKYLETL